jgi:crotonobetainyl-CoA:carnitine CoA-transferase CaiB-like acyl-CoA transferase
MAGSHSGPAAIREWDQACPLPTLGEHTREVLPEHGYGEAYILSLLEKKVFAGPL